ncbi:NAD(P)H-dependent oxidoreductase [Flavivirga amylovorans]|uniref:NAD(P)H-dependent oxidoreductase n=1 Tax=Flavivirga amylovorans TaxID=870486 RepID=A0ABT8X0N5_9FLAO|nr:NAD(P)H-dependent oxidoreductase [Flavivirga amylovorans]MDO5987494.1 NAD(P)H-dependent oxidoreductase [Flavivirga amylovorans]
MDTIKQLQWRYATKKFNKNKKLSGENLNILKEAFNLTATSFGLQTIKLVVVEDEAKRVPLVKHSFNQKQVIEASHLLVICIQNDITEEDINMYYGNIKSIRDTSDAILDPYRLDLINTMKNMSIKERQQWSKNQAYIALGNLMTVCAVEGIDSCPMEGFLPKEFDDVLGLDEMNLKSVLLLPVGYRADDDMFSEFEKVRKSIDDAIIEL